MNSDALDLVAKVYELIIDIGVYRVSSIKVAEAIKVAENSQRDVNIAFINELALVFDRMGIDTNEVVDGMDTKWNALGFRPGLVGGHCIGVDPYYFIYEAERLGYHSLIIQSGRRINDSIGQFIAGKAVKMMIKAGVQVSKANVGVLGITFKENCPDVRNTRVIDIINELCSFDANIIATDSQANSADVFHEYGIKLLPIESLKELDCLIIAVPHKEYGKLTEIDIRKMFKRNSVSSIVDVKGLLRYMFIGNDYYWSL
jgi:UDP-N-acetyl-D-galactosamine dehydrogenase